MTREEAIKVLEEWAGSGTIGEDCWIHFESDLDDVDAALDMAIAALMELEKLESSDWISVEERLPEEAERVLVRLDGDKPPIGEPRMDTDRVVDGRWVRWNELVTHWMPLPEPPEVEA